jgi:L-rhamnose-H+ transport protein
MGHQLGLGLLLVFAGGMLNGSFAAPLKKLPAWRWENSWLIYSLTGLLIVPWIVAFATVPSLVGVYQHSSFGVIVKVAFFGFAWGIGGLLFGMGMERVGLALGFALILGITSSFGALIPLYMLHPDQLHARPGIALMAGTVVMTLGLIVLAIAGKRRERDQAAVASSKRQNFFVGLVICFLSGIFSAMLNFAFVFGDEMHGLTLYAGASPAMASNAIWALSVTCGCVPNVLYCLLLLFKNRTWGVYKQATSGLGYVSGAALMGVLWFIGIMIYGVGAFVLGPLGGIVGWPVFISTAIIAGNLWGFLGGEWKGASRAALTYCLSGIAILFVAIVVISMGNRS